MNAHSSSCAKRLRVLADETRLAVMRELLRRPCNVGELNEAVRVEQSLLSHHLRVLRDAGLVESEREGKAVRYRIAPGVESAAAGQGIDLGCCRLTFSARR
jgi:ArsR family transcriptional regulator